MSNKQVLVYGVLESINDLRSIFVGHIHYEISKIYWNISLLDDQAQVQEIRFVLIILIDKDHFKKQKYGSVSLRNIQSFKILMKYFTVAWPDSGTQIWVFLYHANTQEPF